MQKYIRHQSGFTVVDFFIIVIIIGIISAIIVNIISINQIHAQDTSRKQAIENIATALHRCKVESSCISGYPTLEQLTDLSPQGFRAKTLSYLKPTNLVDPNGNTIQSDEISSVNQYEYVTSPVGCTGIDGDEPCTSFVLKAYQELTPMKPYIIQSGK